MALSNRTMHTWWKSHRRQGIGRLFRKRWRRCATFIVIVVVVIISVIVIVWERDIVVWRFNLVIVIHIATARWWRRRWWNSLAPGGHWQRRIKQHWLFSQCAFFLSLNMNSIEQSGRVSESCGSMHGSPRQPHKDAHSHIDRLTDSADTYVHNLFIHVPTQAHTIHTFHFLYSSSFSGSFFSR